MQVRPTTVPVPPAAPEVASPWVGNVLIARLDARADLSEIERMPRGDARRVAAFEALRATARATQGAALAALAPLQATGTVTSIESMFLPNAIVVKTRQGAQQAVRDALAGVAHVASVTQSRQWNVDDVAPAGPVTPTPGTSWGLDKIGAPIAWASGATGAGITVGVIDSGFLASHDALRAAYRGSRADGTQVHDYNWFDGIEGQAAPVETRGHGTHVAGIVAGSGIGVAPGARIIAARAINTAGNNTTDATLRSLQWMLAPTKIDGSDPDPTKGADVVNNSWGTSNGAEQFYRESYEGLRAAGVEIVTAAGNTGPEPGSVAAPGSYPGFISAASTDQVDTIAYSSARGPSPVPHEPGSFSPTFAAPGVRIVSAATPAGFETRSGTSMASPMIAGAIAVLLGAVPTATHAQLTAALAATAVDLSTPGPDIDSGFGRIDLAAALAYLRRTVTAAD